MTGLTRRDALSLFSGLAALGLMPASAQDANPEPAGLTLGPASPFDPAQVVAKARALAAAPYAAPPAVSQEWLDLTYDQSREIWFDTRHTLFRGQGSSVEAEFFVAGLYQPHKIAINAVTGDQSQPVLFELRVFDTTDRFPALDETGTGFSGFRLLGELETKDQFQEYAVFQGASYFRAIARGQAYGLSARGLALGTASPDGEEFPVFREFWVEQADPGSDTAIVHALLDSPSVSGAYRFAIRKGESTTIAVEATLFPRVELTTVGIAPGTSMYLFSDLNRLRFDDFREAVHDSDGLLVQTGNGETLWRPLMNPVNLEFSAFADTNPRGFGLMQRARDPQNYNDFVAHYERRPSLWVEPGEPWGAGHVVLIEIPTDKEINDNIVAFWRPEAPLAAGSEHHLSYRLFWCDHAPTEGTVSRITASRSGARVFEDGRIFTVDFEAHPSLGDDPERIETRVTASAGEISHTLLQRNAATGGMRLDVTLRPMEETSAELRAELWREGQRISEVWLYRWIKA